MTTKRTEILRPASTLLSLLLALGLIMLGCPETTDDDDTTGDDDTGDDDTGDDDASDDDTGDDDTGDDDTGDDDAGEGTGTMTLTGGGSCGPIQSALVLEFYGPGANVKFWGDIVASTEPWTCAQIVLWEDAISDADWAFSNATMKAYKAQDGAAMCAAYITYYTELQAIYAARFPVGSCTLWLHPSGIAPGVYDIMGQEPLRYDGYVEIVAADYYQAMLDYLAACKGVKDWKDWMALEYGMWKVGYDAWEWWDIYEGTMTLGKGSDITAVGTKNLVENYGLKATGTLDFDLDAVWCSKVP